MSRQRWQQVKEVFERALEQPLDRRAAFLDRACDGDAGLRREVESLLAADAESDSAVDLPIFDLRSHATPATRVGSRIGPWRLIEKIGRGGFGTVYLADRVDDFRQRVAVKLIPRGMSSPEALRRFELERQILADLDHPKIARLFDGGTTGDGSPYLVMEWVDGERIDRYCDARRLSVEARLDLFLEICSAVQFAHRRLVVHRDLKPANVLVTAGGVKLLDFGIAKLLGAAAEPRDTLTVDGSAPMTYDYASPEQATGRTITTASDVYSLGVLLFELLTGHRPYRLDDCDTLERLRRICEQEPSKPSTTVRRSERLAAAPEAAPTTAETASAARAESPASLRRRLRGDLDSILLKALRKDSENRYSSVDRLAEDVRRHLEGRPVSAREGTAVYRLAKFVRRNRLRVAAVAALALLTAAGLAMQARNAAEIASVEAARAAASSREAAFRSELLRNVFSPSDLQHGGKLTPRELLIRGEERMRSNLRGEALATQLEMMGLLYRDLGLDERAGALLREALEMHRERHPGDHQLVARALNNLASWLYRGGEYGEAERLYREALEMRRRLGQDDSDLDTAMSNLASILMKRGEYDRSEELYRRVLAIRRKVHGASHYSVARTLRSLGVLLYNRGEMERAEPKLREALRIRLRAFGEKDARVASAQSSLARVLHHLGRNQEAGRLLTEVLDTRIGLLGDEHLHVALTRKDLAAVHLSEGETETAGRLLGRALAVLRRPENETSWEIAEAESLWGAYLTAAGSFEEAETLLIESYSTLLETRGPESIYSRDADRRLGEHYAARGVPLPEWLQGLPRAPATVH